jgi:TM2 domain-containing membrane protein YozV
MTKDHCTACACLLFCGPCGGHRCYLDDICCGVLYFFTLGFVGIGVLLDCCYLGSMVQAANLKYAGGRIGEVVVHNNISNTNNNGSQYPQQSYQPQQQSFQPQQQPYQPQQQFYPPQQQFYPPQQQPYNNNTAQYSQSAQSYPDYPQGRSKGGL